jgi:hypothetical protein
MSYGTEAGVAVLCRRFTNAGSFDTTTNPLVATVTGWLAQVSSLLDVALATEGFAVPITAATITPMLSILVNVETCDLVNAANSAGRFYTEKALEFGISPMNVIRKDILAWVSDNAAGLVAMGAVRSVPDAGQVAYRDVDDDGNEIDPLFQRHSWGGWKENGGR